MSRFEWESKRHDGKKLLNRPHVINNAGGTRYFSSVDASIYFGDTFIDEVVEISYVIQQQSMPIYGYNSYTFDDMAIGSRLIRGSFTVNFVQSNFIGDLVKALRTKKKHISRKTYGEDIEAKSIFTDEARAKRNTPLYDAGFDILIGQGRPSGTQYEQYRILDCCQILSCQTQLDINGMPVMETYEFMARDIKFNMPKSEAAAAYNLDDNDNSDIKRYINDDTGLLLSKDKCIINIKDSSKKITLSLNSNKLPDRNIIIIPELDNDNFALGKDLKHINSELVYSLTSEETLRIQLYANTYSTDRIEGIYKYILNGKTYEEKIMLKILK